MKLDFLAFLACLTSTAVSFQPHVPSAPMPWLSGGQRTCERQSLISATSLQRTHALRKESLSLHRVQRRIITMRSAEDGNTAFTEIRYLDYRRDSLPVEKAAALSGEFTYAEAWKAVVAGKISVNGSKACAGQLVKRCDVLSVEGRQLPKRQQIVYYLLWTRNKPRGVMSTCKVGPGATKGEQRKAEEGGTVIDLLPRSPRVVPIGRLDFESEGLLVLSNDGSLCKLLASPQFNISKTYAVQIQPLRHGKHAGVPLSERLQHLQDHGAVLQSGVTLRCESARILHDSESDDLSWVEVVLGEGKNREVRKMMRSIGCVVLRLVRTRIGPLAGPISQEREIGAGLAGVQAEPAWDVSLRDEEAASVGEEGRHDTLPGGTEGGPGGCCRAWELRGREEAEERLVARGAELEPGMVTCLGHVEVDALFELVKTDEGSWRSR